MSRVVVVSAGPHPASSTERLADLVREALRSASPDARVTRIPLARYGRQISENLISCRLHEDLSPLVDALREADGLVIVTPVHNASYSALFKAFFDQVPRGLLRGTPTLMAASGGSPRDTLVLDTAVRPYLSALRALVVPTGVHVAPTDRDDHGRLLEPATDRVAQAVGELLELAEHHPVEVGQDRARTR